MVDGIGVGDVGNSVINERKRLSTSGVVVIAATFDEGTKELLYGPELYTRGLVYVKEYGDLLDEAKIVLGEVLEHAYEKDLSISEMKDVLKSALKKFIYHKTNREPVILPVITTVY